MGGNTIEYIQRSLRFTVRNGEPGEDRYERSQVRGYVRPESVWYGHESRLPIGRRLKR
jgi:hypothetical protein